MAEEIQVFPKAVSLRVHTGNIVNWDKLKRKPNQTSTEELKDCINEALGKYLSEAERTELQYTTDLVCVNTDFKLVLVEDRNELKISAKLFLCTAQPADVIRDAVNKLLRDLKTADYIETLMLSLRETGDEEVTVEQIKPYWEVMQELMQAETVLSLGICDLDKARLEQLYQWAKIKPAINQVNLASCCVMPADLTEYAKQLDIQLLTHNDEPDIMPVKTLKEAIRGRATEKDSENWEPMWALRYSVLVRCRGIVNAKGYIFKASRNVKPKPF